MLDRTPIVRLENVTLNFKRRKSFFRHQSYTALDGISFSIYEGETLGIIGRNGCGKSTLLKVISGILEPDAGTVSKGDISISLQTLAAGFDEELSGRDNAILSSMLLGHSKKFVMDNLDKIQEFTELESFFDEPVKTYSSGMRARLGFSVAITMEADILLIDEVLGVGDANFRQRAENAIIQKMVSNQTVVFVSHSLGQVKRLCDRVIWVDKGKIRMVGEPDTVISQYQSE